MKKIIALLVTLFVVFGFAGCIDVGTTELTTGGTNTSQTTLDLAAELPDEEVEITFWHIYGQSKSALLDQLIAEFEAMYPNVTITSTSQSDYTTLLDKINLGISVDQVPTMALGYPDHFAGYITADAVLKLDDYINSEVEYEITDSTSTIFGDTVSVGLDLDDFVPSYLAENNQYEGGFYYSVPFSKSTEVMAVNVDVLKAHKTEIAAAGITISDNGYLSHETPLTFDQIEALAEIVVDTNGTNATTMKCEYLMNFDSSGNMFINMSRQWNAPYTNLDGDILIENDTTESMLNYLQDKFDDNTVVLPIVWEQLYGSYNFVYGDVCMSAGSTAGVEYNIPDLDDDPTDLKLGMFDVDYIQIPQFVSTEGAQFTVDIEGVEETFTGSLSAVQQGPNIGIMADASASERLYSWLFIKYLIDTDSTARWSMDTGYLPARLSSLESETEIELTPTFSITFSNFLEIAQDFWEADGDVDWGITDERWDYLHSSMAVNIAAAQNDYYNYDPAFPAASGSAGSATARIEAGYCLENVYIGTLNTHAAYDPVDALDTMVNQLIW